VLRRQVHSLAGARIELVTDPGLDQHVMAAGANQVAVEGNLDPVERIRLSPAAPHGFGNHTEEDPAIPTVQAGGDVMDFEIAQDNTRQAVSP
jgi:hypothetical protein